MLLTIATTHPPATDLGYLLYKNPARLQTFDLSFGRAHVFYPQATESRCEAALLLDVDPVGLVRGRGAGDGVIDQYVNDRPYVASSFLSVAISQVYGTALSGKCRDRPALAGMPIPLEARLSVMPSRGGEPFLRRLFEPLGYEIEAAAHQLDPAFPEWGLSRYYTLTLRSTCRLQDLLRHLYVLVPVLDDQKHYYVGDAEVDKLLDKGEGWLGSHPERELIARRYLRHRRSLIRDAIARLISEDDAVPDESAEGRDAEEQQVEKRIGLNDLRLSAVMRELKASGASRVVDLGCGEGRLLKMLLGDPQFHELLGMDVSIRPLEIARDRLELDRMPDMQRHRIRLIHGSLMYRDARIAGYDAAAVVEVIEHLDPPRLRAFERVLFEHARPASVVMTTPNREYNEKFETLPAGAFRHRDHRFEWTRAEFESWAAAIAGRFDYAVRFAPVGPVDEVLGSPTQMGVFERLKQA